jgi:hypothetical protein
LIAERAALERDYAFKLESLAKKFASKKDRKIRELVMGQASSGRTDESNIREALDKR